MLSATGSVTELLQFLINVLLWIILPVLSIAAGLTILFHYRNKKKEEKNLPSHGEMDFLWSAEQSIYKKNQADYIIFDHSDLIQEYKRRLAYSHARCFVLQHDLSKLRSNHLVSPQNGHILPNLKKENMETPDVNMETAIQNFSDEKKELMTRLDELNRANKYLELENISLAEQLRIRTGSDDSRSVTSMRLEAENLALKKKIAEQDWLQELVNEKKSEIEFLQSKLELRIRNDHSIVQEREELRGRLIQLEDGRMDLEKRISENNEVLAVARQDLQSKTDQSTWLENELKQAKEQNEMLYAAAADRRDEAAALQEKLSATEERLEIVKQKFSVNKQLLRRFYREISNYVDQETDQTPVIELQQGISSGSEDSIWAG